jgi:hypothetical protein
MFLLTIQGKLQKPSEELHDKQKHERRYGRTLTSLTFGNGYTALSCIDSNNNTFLTEFLTTDVA